MATSEADYEWRLIPLKCTKRRVRSTKENVPDLPLPRERDRWMSLVCGPRNLIRRPLRNFDKLRSRIPVIHVNRWPFKCSTSLGVVSGCCTNFHLPTALKCAYRNNLAAHLHNVEPGCWYRFPLGRGQFGQLNLTSLQSSFKLELNRQINPLVTDRICFLISCRGLFWVKIQKNSNYTSFDREFDADFENHIFRMFCELGDFIQNFKVLKWQFRLEN